MASKDKRLQWTLEEARNKEFSNYSSLNEKIPDSRQNNPFAYPGPFPRNISGPSSRLNPKITRGFMRSILMDETIANKLNPGGKNPGNLRLNFQFNPEYIERRVSQSPGAVNPLLQNPANLTQAVPGTAQFNFTMMFNREAEVAQRRKNLTTTGVVDSRTGTADRLETVGLNITENATSLALKDPGQVGVMHDLAIFDSIIGQGITSELVDVISAYTRQQVVAQTNNAEEDEDIPVFEDSSFRAAVSKNFGNSAFLNPMPVRIVFSDLFMVEGLIVGSAVAFQKFSQEMIPTMCQVNCDVYALYVGFAKKTAFLTDNLTSWAVTTATEQAKTTAEVNKQSKEIKQSLIKLNLSVNSENGEPQSLSVPNYNSDAMRVLVPNYSSNFYAGNVSNAADRFVTLPQWFNAFAANSASLGIMKNSTGQFVGTDVFQSYGGNSLLPITLYVHTTDAEFSNVVSTFTVTIEDTTTAQNKSTVVSNSGSWNKIKDSGEYGLFFENSKTTPKTYVFRNTLYIDPVDVNNKKETISQSSRCKLSINVVFKKTLANGSEAIHTQTFDFFYNGNEPFFYDVTTGADRNGELFNKKMMQLKSNINPR